jgi:nitrite reductase/ring-hydroxylating ferredoxin subunit
VPTGLVPRGLFWDTEDPYHYVRLHAAPDQRGVEYIIVGGEDHKTGQTEDYVDRWTRLEDWMRIRLPEMGAIRHRWSGQVFETLDGLALIGPDPGNDDNIYIATGDSGMGLTHGTVAGLLLRDLILGRENAWTELFEPTRMPIKSTDTVLAEGTNLAAQYRDWFTPGEISKPEEVPPGRGAILRRGLTKVAVYRDDEGTLHELSAICPHMGCVVHWNDGESTWDCPCHGSRFTAEGHCLHGPATDDLTTQGTPQEAAH